jgi:hypothetical protein
MGGHIWRASSPAKLNDPFGRPAGFPLCPFKISWLESLLLGARAQTDAKNPARIIPAGADAVLDAALICQCRSSFARKKYRKKYESRLQIGKLMGPRLPGLRVTQLKPCMRI